MDPLSITVGVASLLGCCLSTGVALRQFRIGASEVNSVITAMMADLRAFRTVLESLETTFEDMNSDRPETGHIGAHWNNISQLLDDCQQSLVKLQLVIEDVSKQVKILDRARKQIRIKVAADQIITCRQEVQTYKDALQLSLQTITLWNTHDIKGTADELLISSRATHQDLQRLATNVELKLTALQTLFMSSNELGGIAKITNIKRTINSAATVIAGNNTDVANPAELDDLTSEFGNWFRSEASQNTLDWIYSDKREEPILGLDGLNYAKDHTVNRTLPVHTSPQISWSLGSLDRNANHDTPKHISNRGTSNLLSRSPASAPTLLAPHTLMHANEHEESEIQSGDVDNEPDSDGDDTNQNSVPRLLPTIEVSEESSQKSHKKRRSWFRSSKSINSLVVRNPMIDDAPPKSSRWRTPKLPRKLKIVFVGDGAAGKICLILLLTKGVFPLVYVPTVFENYVGDYEINNKPYEVGFWDTAGQEDFDRVRPLSYPDSDAIIISFSIDSPDSLANVEERWILEVRHFNPGLPIFLIGCKKDLRKDPNTIRWLATMNQKPVTYKEADKVRKKIGALAYFETSAKTTEGAYDAMRTILEMTVAFKIGKNNKK